MESSSDVTENVLVIDEHCTQLLHHDTDLETVFVVKIVLCKVTNIMSPHENVCVSEAWIIPVKERKFYACYACYTYMYTLKIIFIKNFKMMLQTFCKKQTLMFFLNSIDLIKTLSFCFPELWLTYTIVVSPFPTLISSDIGYHHCVSV